MTAGDGSRTASEEVVVVLRDVDSASSPGDLRHRLAPVLERGSATIVVDLSGLSRLSSGAVGTLLWMRAACIPRGVGIRLRHLPRGSHATLRRTGLASALRMEVGRP